MPGFSVTENTRLELGEELLTIWFLAFLALIWIAFFLPGAERARRQTPFPAAMRFKRAMRRVAPAKPAPRHGSARRRPGSQARPAAHRARTDSGRWIIVPHDAESRRQVSSRRLQRRRRRLLALLVLFAVASAGVAIWRGGSWRELHLIADGILIFYVAMLFETKRRRQERSEKVIRLDEDREDDFRVIEPVRAGGHRS